MRTTKYGPLQNTLDASACNPTSANFIGKSSATFVPIVSATFSSETTFAAIEPIFEANLFRRNPEPILLLTLIINEEWESFRIL